MLGRWRACPPCGSGGAADIALPCLPWALSIRGRHRERTITLRDIEKEDGTRVDRWMFDWVVLPLAKVARPLVFLLAR